MFDFFKKIFSKHYAIEKFGVLFIILLVGLVSTTGSIFIRKASIDHTNRENAAIYTTGFQMSKSNAVGHVSGLFTDEAHTKAFLVLTFEDMSMLPTDPKDYSIMMAGAKDNGDFDKIKSNPTASMFMFGQSGTIGLYFEEPNGFPSQLVQVMLQSHQNLTGRSSDGSYDQGLIYFNPGGGNTTKASFLEKENWTMFDMVEETITRRSEIAARNELTAYLDDMVQQQVLIDEYSNRLEGLGVSVPGIPAEINDDLYAKPKDTTTNGGEILHYTTEQGGGWLNDEGTFGLRSDAVTIYLDSRYTFSNGFDFNWQDGRILTGYLEQLTNSTSIRAWNKYIENRTGAEDDNSFESTVKSIEWKYKDGTPIVVGDESSSSRSSGGNDQRTTEVLNTINMLRGAWRAYYNDKKAYETESLPKLLQLEAQSKSLLSTYDTNDDPDFLTVVYDA